MKKVTSVAAFAAITALALPAFAQSQAEIANRLNDEGKEAMYGKQYSQASAKFRECVARVPEPKYFFNLCTALFQEGQFGEALVACDAVANNNPSPELAAKATKLIAKIEGEATAQGLPRGSGEKPFRTGGGGADPGKTCATNPEGPGCQPPPPTCQSNPSLPECQPQPAPPTAPPVVGRPPNGTGLFAGTTPDNKYIWTLGADLFGGAGTIGQEDAYGTAAFGFRLKGDYQFLPAQRVGTEVYIQYARFTAGKEQMMTGVDPFSLDVIDLGAALYKHLCLTGTQRLCVTPLVGVQLALFSPQGNVDELDGTKLFNYAGVGGRAEVGLQYAFGTGYEHVLSVTFGGNGYTQAFSGPSADNPDGFFTSQEVGLDKGGFYGYVGVGYTHRFSTPLGSVPFVTLE